MLAPPLADAADRVEVDVREMSVRTVEGTSVIFRPRSRVTMPWNERYYPRSMENLPPVVRRKAIDIANALLEEGYEEGMAIRIAIARAKAWTERHGSS